MTKECFEREVIYLTDTMYGVARIYLRSPEDCKDAVQESILKAWSHLSALRREEYFRTWIIRILINECKTMRKRKWRTVSWDAIPETGDSPAQDNTLYETMMTLPEKYRVPLVLYHCEGCTVQEIAQILRLPKGTVTSRLARGREILKRDYLLREVCFHEG